MKSKPRTVPPFLFFIMYIKHFILLCFTLLACITSSAQTTKKKTSVKKVTTVKKATTKKKPTTSYSYRKKATRPTAKRQNKPNVTSKTTKVIVQSSPKTIVTQTNKSETVQQANQHPQKTSLATDPEPKERQQGKGEFNLRIGYDFALKGSGGSFTFQPEYGWHIGERVFWGIGSGIVTDSKFSSIAIPVFTRIEVSFLPGKEINPFVSFQGGYDIAISSDQYHKGCIRLNPFTGFRTQIGKNTDLTCGFGYTRTIVSGYGADFLGFQCGLSFDSNGKGAKRFFSSLDYEFELETYTPVTTKYENDKENKCNKFYGLRFSITGPIIKDYLYAGLSLGAGRYTFTDQVQNNYEEVSNEIYANVMARVKYKAKQLAFGKKLYPYAQIDFGERGATPKDHISFVAIPSVGISMATGKKQSIDASIGYDTNAIDGDMDKKSGSIRIAIGYTL